MALTFEIMGAVALVAFGVNALLTVAMVLKRRGELGRLLRALKRAGVQTGVVSRGAGPDGALATHTARQLGWAWAASEPTIGFDDDELIGVVHGGTVALEGGGALEIPAEGRDAARVWVSEAARRRAAADAEAEAAQDGFEVAWDAARRSRGWSRELVVSLDVGRRVWVSRGDTLWVADEDPRRWLRRKRWEHLGFAFVLLALAAGIVGACLWPPAFGVVSTIGGVLGITYFLAVPAVAKIQRDAARLPGERELDMVWTRSNPDEALRRAA